MGLMHLHTTIRKTGGRSVSYFASCASFVRGFYAINVIWHDGYICMLTCSMLRHREVHDGSHGTSARDRFSDVDGWH